MVSAQLVRCPYCRRDVDYSDHLGTCPGVRFALDPSYTVYTNGHNIDEQHPEKYRGVAPNQALLGRGATKGKRGGGA